MRFKHNMISCIGISLIFLIMFAGNATASGGGGSDYELVLTPSTDANPVGTQHTVTATVKYAGGSILVNSGGVENVNVKFEVISGPHVGQNGTGLTDVNGIATWSYEGTTVGVDRIQAISSDGSTAPSNVVTKEWTSDQTEIPEFPTIALPIIAVLGLAFFFQRRKD